MAAFAGLVRRMADTIRTKNLTCEVCDTARATTMVAKSLLGSPVVICLQIQSPPWGVAPFGPEALPVFGHLSDCLRLTPMCRSMVL